MFAAAVAAPAGSNLAQISSTNLVVLAQISTEVSIVDQAALPFTCTPCPNDCVGAPQVTQDTWAILKVLKAELQRYLNFILWLDQQLLAAQEMNDMDCDTLATTWRSMI